MQVDEPVECDQGDDQGMRQTTKMNVAMATLLSPAVNISIYECKHVDTDSELDSAHHNHVPDPITFNCIRND